MKKLSSVIFFCLLAISCFAQGQFEYISTATESRKAIVRFEKPVTLSWITPSTSSPAYEESRTFNISLRIVSPYEIAEKDIVVYVNNKVFDGKSGEVKIRRSSEPTQGNEYLFEKEVSVDMSSAETTLKIIYNAPSGISWSSKEMIVKHIYDQAEATLHLLCVGIGTYNDYSELVNLKYAERDAESIYNIFTKQRGLFGRVNKLDLLTGQNANSSNLIAQLNTLQQLALDGDINESDVILIYISSHGVLVDGDFRLATSDYRIQAKERSTVSYKKEILKILEEINCKKVIFLDACHSGIDDQVNAKSDVGDLSDAIEQIVNTPSGISTIASSKATELSYELDIYRHGSFTQAILEGLQGSADREGEGIIDLNELFEYVQRRVPLLNKEEGYPLQTPTRSVDNLGGLPIFSYE